MTARGWWVLLALLAGCGGHELSGATSVRAGSEPHPSSAGATFVPTTCRDAAGRPASLGARLWLVQTENARELLVVSRDGFDSLLVSNRAVLPQSGSVAFQFFTDDGNGPLLLHDVRFPGRDGDPSVARLTVTDRHTDPPAGKLPLAAPGRPLLTCELRARRPAAEH